MYDPSSLSSPTTLLNLSFVFSVQGSGLRDPVLGLGVSGSGFQVSRFLDPRFQVSQISGLGFRSRVLGFRFRDLGSGFHVLKRASSA